MRLNYSRCSLGEGVSAVGSKRKSIRTVIFRKDNQQGPAVEHRELCSMLCGSLDGRGVWGRMYVYVYMYMYG